MDVKAFGIKQVLSVYRAKIEEIKQAGLYKLKCPFHHDPANHCMIHSYRSLELIENLIDEGMIKRGHDRLTFVQGCFWCCGVYTADELRNHNHILSLQDE